MALETLSPMVRALLAESNRQREQSAPKLAPEEVQSLLAPVMEGVMSGVQWVGDTLDKFGRTGRSLLFDESGAFDLGGAQLSDLLHAVPFSDTLGWTRPEDAPSEQVVRENFGWTSDTGNPWIDTPLNLATDVAIGVFTDPATLIAGPGKALTKLGVEAMQQGARVGKALSFSDEIAAAGKNALLGTSPARYADEIRAGQRGLIGLKLPFAEHPFMTFGAGSETAAKAADFLSYSPFSPSPWIRQLFDTRVRGQAPWAQRLEDLAHSKALETSAEIIDKKLAIDKRLLELRDHYDHTIKTWLEQNPQAAKELTGGVPLDQMDPGSLVRAIAELKTGSQSMQQIVQRASQLAGTQAPADVLEASRLFDEVAAAATDTKDKVFNVYRSLGGDVTELDDDFINHFPRRLSELMAGQMGKAKANKNAKDVWGAIQRNIRNIEGGTYKVNAISRDPRVTGWWDDTDPALRNTALQNAEQILATQYGLPTARRTVDDKGNPIVQNMAREFAGYMSKLPAAVVNEGLFSRSLTTDLMDYSLNMMRRANGLQAVHGLTLAAASDDVTIGPTIQELFTNLKMTDVGVQKFVADYAKKAGLNPADVDASQIYVPHAAKIAAERMLHYNTKPKDLIGPVKLLDNVLNLHKAGLYAPWPASHTRNAISGLWQNLVTAFRSPADAAFGLKEARDAMLGKGNREWLDAFKAYALHNGLQIDDALEVAKAQATDIPTGIASTLLSAGKDYTVGTAKNVLGLAKTGLKAAKFDFSDIKRAASDEGFRELLGEFGPFKGGRKLGDLVEFINRYSHFAALKQRGWTNAAAARSVKLAHFDYSPQALTPFENQVMKRLIPFYRFARGNLPLQLKSLIDEPGGRAAQSIRAINTLREQKEQEGGYVPSYLSEGISIPWGSPVDGQQTFLTSSEILPFEEAFNRFPFFDNKLDVLKTAENIGSMVNPTIGTPVQMMSGRQWWSHRDIDDLYQTPTGDQNWNFLLANLPTARALSTTRMVADERKTELQRLLNFLVGGGRFTTVDIPKWMNIESREVLQRMLEPASGVLEGQYLFAPDPSQLTEEQITQLSILTQLQQENRKMNKERKARDKR